MPWKTLIISYSLGIDVSVLQGRHTQTQNPPLPQADKVRTITAQTQFRVLCIIAALDREQWRTASLGHGRTTSGVGSVHSPELFLRLRPRRPAARRICYTSTHNTPAPIGHQEGPIYYDTAADAPPCPGGNYFLGR
ncbi:jg1219 [Pararge aegeria aegeria]|uniref:Jg1219 protein n=1 Tax=Pararge aegeria aegeria TaxID=348720 RepID=A0A8S4R9B1_9NEOP|nr:jg1219 [Pararge aegeria aegeria]